MTEFSPTATEMIISSVEGVAWLPEMMLTHRANLASDDEQTLLSGVAGEVKSLLENGYVLLCRDNWSRRIADPIERQVNTTEVSQVLQDSKTWVWDDDRDEYYVLVATDKGREAFQYLVGKDLAAPKASGSSRPPAGNPIT